MNIGKTGKCLFFILSFLAAIQGCGYHLVGHDSNLPPDVRSIAIPTFVNSSSEPGIETTFTQLVRDEFIRDGRLKVASAKRADWLLNGRIQEYSLKPVSFDSSDNVTAYWIEMTLVVELLDNRNQKKIFERTFHPHWDYQVTSGVTLSNIRRVEGINNAAMDFGRTLISLIIEGF